MKNLVTAILMTIVTTILLGLIYPLVVTGLAQVIFPDKRMATDRTQMDGDWLAYDWPALLFAWLLSIASIGRGRGGIRWPSSGFESWTHEPEAY